MEFQACVLMYDLSLEQSMDSGENEKTETKRRFSFLFLFLFLVCSCSSVNFPRLFLTKGIRKLRKARRRKRKEHKFIEPTTDEESYESGSKSTNEREKVRERESVEVRGNSNRALPSNSKFHFKDLYPEIEIESSQTDY